VSEMPFVAVVFATAFLFIGGCLLVTRELSHHYSVVGCKSFERETGRPTTFVDYHYWDWDCLTPGADGKLISTKALRDFVEAP
jgi:hypothetical protein